ncbi:hypothetical protein CHS0354_023829 [Potamilus streckersoni]|uniref:Uncharacterized protein n=1 Tax=Potamilus streckersoni TaxID=2493646 RepID=A0AAE0RZB9_9BIVA|nr:hypothetical protein CHS0354_023829 [Potamilus streckersoni]
MFNFSPPEDFYDVTYGNLIDELTLIASQEIKSGILSIQKQYQMSDWLTFEFIQRVIESMKMNGDAKVVSFLCMLRGFGYHVTLVKPSINGKEHLGLGIVCKEKVFGVSFLRMDDMYVLMYDVFKSALMTVENQGVHVFDMKTRSRFQLSRVFNLGEVGSPVFPLTPVVKKDLVWEYAKEEFHLNVAMSAHLLKYYNNYPQLGIAFHFAPLPYKEDSQTDYGERCNFPEETIFAKYSDCEDRSVLLAKLVELIIKCDVVGLKFKNHISIGVKIDELNENDFTVKDRKGTSYIHCDPSFMKSRAGDVNDDLIRQEVTMITKTN